jgi:ABC-type multidrug transport system fused ATPase/permease subunit
MSTYIKRFWKDNLIVGLLLLGSALSQTIASILNASALNALIALDLRSFLIAAGQMFTSFLFLLFFTYLHIVKTSQTKQKMLTAIREDITSKIESTSYSHFHDRQVGTYASWLSNDMSMIETQSFDGFYSVLTGIIASVTSITALFFFHWSLVVWSLAAAGLTLLLPRLYQKKMAAATLHTTQENERFLGKSTEVLGGYDTLFSLSLLRKLTTDIKKASIALAEARNDQARVIGRVAILGAFGNVFGQMSVLILTGLLAFRALISIGSIATTGSLAGTIFNTVGNISQQVAAIRSTQPIFDKFDSILATDETDKTTLLELTDGFKIRDAGYSFGDKRIFSGIDFTFDLGRKYAVVGSSGSGKSTLLNILNGKLTDYHGSIALSRRELKTVSGKALRSHILYVDQMPYLFNESILYNITLGEHFTEAEISQALIDSDLDTFVSQLPDGLETAVGEGGRSLSGGQRQRIALARGLIRGKTCILIDEGTSSLDEESALKIEESLLSNPDLTVIMITHHLRQAIKGRLDGILSLS